MKFIIFHNLKSITSSFGYQTSMKMAYLFNVNVACLGIGKNYYSWADNMKKTDFEFKLNYILNSGLTDDEKKTFTEAKDNFKIYNKTKNKSSKQIVAFQRIKRTIEDTFGEMARVKSNNMNNLLDLDTFKDLINEKDFYIYKTNETDIECVEDTLIPITEILQLSLPDPEKGHPIFFLNIEDKAYKNIPEIETLSPDSENAENRDCIYGETGFTFPLLTALSANETMLARTQLAEPTREFREQLELWAEICYNNPNTNAGLDFFRKNLQPLLKSSEEAALKSPVLKNTSDYTNQNQQTQIIVGEAPIEKIWEIYKELKTISEETYNELLQIKSSQSPKFDGRWPIIFLKSLLNPTDSILPEIDTVQSVRKVIAID